MFTRPLTYSMAVIATFLAGIFLGEKTCYPRRRCF